MKTENEKTIIIKIKKSKKGWEIMMEERWIKILQKEPMLIGTIKDQTEAIQLTAVQTNGLSLEEIRNPTEKVKKAALEQNGHAIEYIENPTKELMLIAVKSNPRSISLIKNPPEEIQMISIEKNKALAMFINNLTKKAALEAFLFFSKEKRSACVFKGEIQDDLFKTLENEDKNGFMKVLVSYKKELLHAPYFNALSGYIANFHKDWAGEFLHQMSPLTPEQKDIWKTHRLKTLV